MSLDQQQAFHKNNIDREVAGLQPMTWDAYMASMGGTPGVQGMVQAKGNQVAPVPQMMMGQSQMTMQQPAQMQMMTNPGQPQMMQQPGQPQMMMQPGQPQMMQQPQAGIQMQQPGTPAMGNVQHHEYRQQLPVKKFNSKICGCIDFWE